MVESVSSFIIEIWMRMKSMMILMMILMMVTMILMMIMMTKPYDYDEGTDDGAAGDSFPYYLFRDRNVDHRQHY